MRNASTTRPIIPTVILRERGASSRADDLAELERLALWMDSAFEIPGLGVRFGLDSLLGLLPGFGDALTSLISLYIIGMASRHGVSRVTLLRMGVNVVVDGLLGSIPLVGDLFDVFWKSNQQNVALLRRHLNEQPQTRRRARTSDWLFVCGLVFLLGLAIAVGVTGTVFAVRGIAQLFG